MRTESCRLCVQAKVNAAKVRLSKDSALVINGGAQVHIKSLDLDGALLIDTAPDAKLVVEGLALQNKGWKWHALNPDKPMTEEQMIRCLSGCSNLVLSCACRRLPFVSQHERINGVFCTALPYSRMQWGGKPEESRHCAPVACKSRVGRSKNCV